MKAGLGIAFSSIGNKGNAESGGIAFETRGSMSAVHFEDRRPRVLVVDDQPSNILSICATLQSLYDVYMSTNGLEAIDLARKLSPDLILLDVVLSDIDGYEVCRRLKADQATSDIPVIFLTGRVEEEDEARGLAVGAIDYIRKPFSPAIALARVRTHLTLKLQNDKLKRLASIDGLTGLRNRRAFDTELAQSLAYSLREQRPMSVLMVDVDFFKHYNDLYGHLNGDQCLQRIAHALEGSVKRPSDFVSRFGGEEFACVLPNTDIQGALQVGECMHQAIEALHIQHEDVPVGGWVTVSIGVACFDPLKGGLPEQLLGAADEALYRAKQHGRNQVSY